jgi:NitT/TauT family transport system permease protein
MAQSPKPADSTPVTVSPPAPFFSVRTPVGDNARMALGASSLLLCVAAWSVLTYGNIVGPFFLPTPTAVLDGLMQLIFDQGLLGAVGVSALRIITSFALSVAVAVPLGVLMGTFDAVNRFFDPIMAPLRYMPITAFIPLLILWFGIEESQKIAFLFLGTFVVDAIRAVPDEQVQTAFTLGATRRQVILHVLIPAALPQIFDSFRVMNAISWTYVILAEIVNPHRGIGYLLNLAQQHSKPEWSLAGIAVVGVIGLVTDLLIETLNRVLFPWRESNG